MLGGGNLDDGEDEAGDDFEGSWAGVLAGACAFEGGEVEEAWAAAPTLELSSKARSKRRMALFYDSRALCAPPCDAGDFKKRVDTSLEMLKSSPPPPTPAAKPEDTQK